MEEVIEKINKLFKGDLNDGDRVIITTLHNKLRGDQKLEKIAKTSNEQMFVESLFPQIFHGVAQDSYVEQTEAFLSLFQNQNKYQMIMILLANLLYREFNKAS